MVSLRQELQALDLYLQIERVRFGDRLQIHYQIEPEAEQAVVPSLILQPIIENAIKHAIAKVEGVGILSLEARLLKEQNCLLLRVCDNGPGLGSKPETQLFTANGVGLSNTLERLKSLYDDQFQFRVENQKPSGLCVEIRFPFQRAGQ